MKLQVIKGDLVVDNQGRILGRLERWDIPPHLLGRRCPNCGELIPVRDWDYHREVCHRIGWGGYHNPIARFTAPQRSRKARTTIIDSRIVELEALLAGC